MKRVLVLKITGKLFNDNNLINEYIELFKKLIKDYKLVIICGGGKLAREYIERARELGVNSKYWLDHIGIIASRLNSYLLISKLYPQTYPKPVETLEELQYAVKSSDITILGGLIPGQSTASVALEVAEALNVEQVIMASAIDHVYDKDPTKYVDAKAFNEIDASKLIEILEQETLPGEYALIDAHALKLAIRSGITIHVVYYRDPENVLRVLKGENPGTIIHPR